MFEGGKSFTTIIVGIIIFIIGFIPLMSILKIFNINIPEIPRIILLSVMAISSLYLTIDGFFELGMHPALAWTSIFLGAAFVIMSVLGMFTSLFPFLTAFMIFTIYIIIGFLLFFAGFMF